MNILHDPGWGTFIRTRHGLMRIHPDYTVHICGCGERAHAILMAPRRMIPLCLKHVKAREAQTRRRVEAIRRAWNGET